MREYLIEKKKQFSEYFTVEKLDMQGRKNEDIKRNMAFCHDINGFVDAVYEEKQIDKNEYTTPNEFDKKRNTFSWLGQLRAGYKYLVITLYMLFVSWDED